MDELLLTEEELAELAASDPESYAEIVNLINQGYDAGPSRLRDADNPALYSGDYPSKMDGGLVEKADRPSGSLGKKLLMGMSLEEAMKRGLLSRDGLPKKDSLDLSDEATFNRFLRREEMAKAAQKMAADRMLGKSRGAAPARQDTVPGAVASSAEEDLAYVEDMLLGDGVSSGATMAELSRAPRRKVLPTMSGLGGGGSSGLGQGDDRLTADFLLQSHRLSKGNPDSDAYEAGRKAIEEAGLFPVRGGRSSFRDEPVGNVPLDPVDEDFNPEDLINMGSFDPESTDSLGMAYLRNAMAKSDAERERVNRNLDAVEIGEPTIIQPSSDRVNAINDLYASLNKQPQGSLSLKNTETTIPEQFMTDSSRKGDASVIGAMTPEQQAEADREMLGSKQAQAMGSMTPQKRRAFRVGQMQKRQEAAGGPIEKSAERQSAENIIEAMVANRNQGQELATLMPSINQFSRQIREMSRPDASLKDLESRIQAANTPQELNALQAQAEKVTSQFGSNAATSRIADSIDNAASTMSSHYRIENAKESDRNQIAADVFGAMSADELVGYAGKHEDYLVNNPTVKTRLSSSLKAMRDKIRAISEKGATREREDILFNLDVKRRKIENEIKRLQRDNFGKEDAAKREQREIDNIKKQALRTQRKAADSISDPEKRKKIQGLLAKSPTRKVMQGHIDNLLGQLNDAGVMLQNVKTKKEALAIQQDIIALEKEISQLGSMEYQRQLTRRSRM